MHQSHTPHKEPEEIFLPLSSKRYAEFYSLEMDNFSKDIIFYFNNIPEASRVLELGCGTGRISRALSSSHTVVGLDLSPEMLLQAGKYQDYPVDYVCMDMTRMAFRKQFDHIIIPYNTLNLLQSETLVTDCLQQVHDLLYPYGTLLFQIYIPEKNILETGKNKHFQFQIFPLANEKGKIIKESIRSYDCENEIIRLEERYRVRPSEPDASKEDLRQVLHLAGFDLEKWLEMLAHSKFKKLSLYGDYNSRPFQKKQDSLLLVKASPC